VTDEQTFRQLADTARGAARNAYAPYTGVQHGAAVLSADGRIFSAGNVEFATFSHSICAELAAITKDVSEGCREFQAVALYPTALPCGACRQFFREFTTELTVVMAETNGIRTTTLSEILPNSFGLPES